MQPRSCFSSLAQVARSGVVVYWSMSKRAAASLDASRWSEVSAAIVNQARD